MLNKIGGYILFQQYATIFVLNKELCILYSQTVKLESRMGRNLTL